MTKHYLQRLLTTAAPLLTLLPGPTARAQQPFDSSAWNISGAEWRVESYGGQSALMLRNGAAWLKGSRFENGTIEFDVAFSNSIAFRCEGAVATHLVVGREQRTARHYGVIIDVLSTFSQFGRRNAPTQRLSELQAINIRLQLASGPAPF